MTAPLGLLLLVVAVDSAHHGAQKLSGYEPYYMYTMEKDEEVIKEFNRQGKPVTVAFQVDDKLYEGSKFKCRLREFAKDPEDRYTGLTNYTEAQNRCYKLHKAEMKEANYDRYAGCMVDSYAQVYDAGMHQYSMLRITKDNKTLIFNQNQLPGSMNQILLFGDGYRGVNGECRRFCRDLFQKLVFEPLSEYVVIGPAINVLRQFRRCWAISRLGDKYNWPEPRL
ncbi:hypothetical protein HDE_08719 [Halotydeus destructor]|nr:hypothetical protein HDE_08719 [Halotydeus destructor]